jgi:hypothetical protein
MSLYRTLRVKEIIEARENLTKIRLDDESRAYCFPQLCGEVAVGDDVVVNTTAVDLGLGTGGWHFVLWNLKAKDVDTGRGGHIMKLRYTPEQLDCGAAEEFDGYPRDKSSIDNMIVIAAPLHSHIPAIASYIKSQNQETKISVLISDGAALPFALSDVMAELTDKKLVDSSVTFGHAFGGDSEAINIYTALITARHIHNSDVAIVSMGPGIVGSNSLFGFTGIEVAHHLDAAQALLGQTYGVLRASSADPRERHRGISHQSLTTYSIATHERHRLAVIENHEMSDAMWGQIETAEITKKHDVIKTSSVGAVDVMESFGLNISSMGRPAREDELFFEMAVAPAVRAMNENK